MIKRRKSRLSLELQDQLLTSYCKGVSARRTATEIGMNRNTVALFHEKIRRCLLVRIIRESRRFALSHHAVEPIKDFKFEDEYQNGISLGEAKGAYDPLFQAHMLPLPVARRLKDFAGIEISLLDTVERKISAKNPPTFQLRQGVGVFESTELTRDLQIGFKSHLRRYRGTNKELLPSYLAEFLFQLKYTAPQARMELLKKLSTVTDIESIPWEYDRLSILGYELEETYGYNHDFRWGEISWIK